MAPSDSWWCVCVGWGERVVVMVVGFFLSSHISVPLEYTVKYFLLREKQNLQKQN